MGHLIWPWDSLFYYPARRDGAAPCRDDAVEDGGIAGPENPGDGASRGSRACEAEAPAPEKCEAEASE